MSQRDPRFDEALGRAIKVLRTEQGIGRKELGSRAEVSYSYLAEIENGTKPASSRVLLAIAKALGFDLHEVVAYAEQLAADAPDRSAEPARTRRAASSAGQQAGPASAASPPASPPASPLASPPASPPAARSWFHRGSAAPLAAAPGVPQASPAVAAEPEEVVAELAHLIPRLSPEDRRHILDLARRLAR